MVLWRNGRVPEKSHWHWRKSSGTVGSLRLLETQGQNVTVTRIPPTRQRQSPWRSLKTPSAGQEAHPGLFSGSSSFLSDEVPREGGKDKFFIFWKKSWLSL